MTWSDKPISTSNNTFVDNIAYSEEGQNIKSLESFEPTYLAILVPKTLTNFFIKERTVF